MDLRSKTDLLQYGDFDIGKVLLGSNKNFEDVVKDVASIKKWMEQQKHLPFVFNDRQIFSFLNISKFSLEKAKTSIDLYFTLKSETPEFYRFDLNHPKLKSFQNNYNLIPLPKLSKNQGRILVCQPTDARYFECDIFFCLFYHLLDVLNSEDINAGWEFIVDLTFATIKMLEKITPEIILKTNIVFEKIYFNRIFSIHFITSYASEKFMETLWENSKPEMQRKIIIHNNYKTLVDHYNRNLLPKDFGGNLKALKQFNGDWQKLYQDNSAHLERCKNARTCENLRTFKITDQEVLEFDKKLGKQILT